MSCRRYCAAEFNLTALRASSKNLYMWTFTFPYFAEAESVREMVRRMVQALNRWGAVGVRVYEHHKSGSLHIHVVCNKFFWVGRVRSYWQDLGGGRVHVKFLNPDDSGLYITKELMKKRQKTGFPKGTRVYAAFGRGWDVIGKSLVGNIRFESSGFTMFLYNRGEPYSAITSFSYNAELFGVGYADNEANSIPITKERAEYVAECS